MTEPPPPFVRSESESHSVVSNSLRFHGILQARILEWVAFPSSLLLSFLFLGLPNPRIEPRSLTMQTDSLPAVRKQTSISVPKMISFLGKLDKRVEAKIHCHNFTSFENTL